ncbi:class I SAM-dependent methyltransferase [Chloroflexi bacterium TSY]|nr:class I SAM-dependent methyltransferase [Chloroflexi bacterium TSY]
MAFSQYNSPDTISAYEERLRNSYPQRAEIIAHIASHVDGYVKTNVPITTAEKTDNSALECNVVSVLELCVGPGVLAAHLLDNLPQVHYTGIDFNQPFLDFTEDRIQKHAGRAQFVLADLRNDDWPKQLGALSNGQPFGAIVTMQSLHDVGNADCISQIYKQCRVLLTTGGILLNVDFVVPSGQEDPQRPGRLSREHHFDLLQKHGFEQIDCTLQIGEFGCFVGCVKDVY